MYNINTHTHLLGRKIQNNLRIEAFKSQNVCRKKLLITFYLEVDIVMLLDLCHDLKKSKKYILNKLQLKGILSSCQNIYSTILRI